MAGVRKNIFEELERVKNLVRVHFPDVEVREVRKILSKLATYHYNKKKIMILGKDKELYNALIENSYNSFTVYRWTLPENISYGEIKCFLEDKNLQNERQNNN